MRAFPIAQPAMVAGLAEAVNFSRTTPATVCTGFCPTPCGVSRPRCWHSGTHRFNIGSIQSGSESVQSVLRTRHPFEVFQAWIHLVAVSVVDLMSLGWLLAKKNPSDKAMNLARSFNRSLRKHDKSIARPALGLSQDAPVSERLFGRASNGRIHVVIEASDAPEVRDFVEALVSRDRTPFFRGIGAKLRLHRKFTPFGVTPRGVTSTAEAFPCPFYQEAA